MLGHMSTYIELQPAHFEHYLGGHMLGLVSTYINTCKAHVAEGHARARAPHTADVQPKRNFDIGVLFPHGLGFFQVAARQRRHLMEEHEPSHALLGRGQEAGGKKNEARPLHSEDGDHRHNTHVGRTPEPLGTSREPTRENSPGHRGT